jgi:Nif-specific regulatory protein
MLKVKVDQKKFETLIEINTEINSNYKDIKSLLTRIMNAAMKLTEGDASSLLLLTPDGERLNFEVAIGAKGEEVKKYSLRVGEGIAGWVVKNNTSIIVNDADSDPRFSGEISNKIGYPTNSILAVPMRSKDKCIGVIEILNNANDRFDEDDLESLEIFSTQAAIAIQNARAYEEMSEEVFTLKDQILTDKGFHTFIGLSKTIAEKLEIVNKVAPTNSSVLLMGESGVGKELFAEQIHLRSHRKDMPFIRVNCAAIPENLLESELFGHVKGAFTGAQTERKGRFELADQGTIFLDEIGDLPIQLQNKLLRVIQHKTFEKVGSDQSVTVDVRIIAATNKDIEKEVQEGKFRADLFYRLNVLPIYIPPLRERKDDIPPLADFFLNKFKREVKKQVLGFSDNAIELLVNYSWPGNVRELENAVERAVVISQTEYIEPDSLILNVFPHNSEEEFINKNLKDAVNCFKKIFITKTLNNNGWKQTKTARLLGIQRTYLSRLIKELKISK